MDTRNTLAANAAEVEAPQTEPREICALATQRTFFTQEEMVLTQTGLCCLFLPQEREVTYNPSSFFLNGSFHLK